MKSLKSLRFDKESITVSYENGENIQEIVDWLFYNHELKNVDISDNSFTFNYKGQRFLGCAIRDFISKTCGCVKKERWAIDKGTYCTEHLRLVVEDGKIFRVTLFNNHGTIGISGFGCWQYGRILAFNDIKEGVELKLFNSFLDGVSHDLLFEEEDCDLEVLIEIGEIQF